MLKSKNFNSINADALDDRLKQHTIKEGKEVKFFISVIYEFASHAIGIARHPDPFFHSLYQTHMIKNKTFFYPHTPLSL